MPTGVIGPKLLFMPQATQHTRVRSLCALRRVVLEREHEEIIEGIFVFTIMLLFTTINDYEINKFLEAS